MNEKQKETYIGKIIKMPEKVVDIRGYNPPPENLKRPENPTPPPPPKEKE